MALCRSVRTAWVPSAEVEHTETVELARCRARRWVSSEASLTAMRRARRSHRSSSSTEPGSMGRGMWSRPSPASRRETGEQLLELAGFAAGRIERGIEVLATDPDGVGRVPGREPRGGRARCVSGSGSRSLDGGRSSLPSSCSISPA